MQKIDQPSSITIEGVEYPVQNFSETVQRLVAIHTEWRNDLQAERLSLAKTEAAVRALDTEISQVVSAELSTTDLERKAV